VSEKSNVGRTGKNQKNVLDALERLTEEKNITLKTENTKYWFHKSDVRNESDLDHNRFSEGYKPLIKNKHIIEKGDMFCLP